MPVKDNKANKEAASQIFLKLAEIRDNVLVLKDGGARAILKVSSVNFELKSEQEQNVIVYAYQDFLNSLEFPLQIVIRSKKLDIDGYLENLTQLAQKQEDELMRNSMADYITYIEKLVELSDIMEKEFYVVIPQDPFKITSGNFFKNFLSGLNPMDTTVKVFGRQREFETLKKGLNQRVSNVQEGLARCGLHVSRLNTHQIIELFYQCYNPTTAQTQKIGELDKLNFDVTSLSGVDDETKKD